MPYRRREPVGADAVGRELQQSVVVHAAGRQQRLRAGQIVVGQQNPSSTSYYQWATAASGGPLDLASSDGTGWSSRNAAYGNAWLTLDVQNSLNVTDLSTTGTAGYTFGQPADQVSRGQLFLDTAITSLDGRKQPG
jgi:hypothetical protein